jgi:uncharacterized protein YcfJ
MKRKNTMKKIILTLVILLFSNISVAFADYYRSKRGIVIDVQPVTITKSISRPYSRTVCNKRDSHNSNKLVHIAMGGLLGSMIGNKRSDEHGLGTIGAVFGSLIGSNSYPKRYVTKCFEKTVYSNEVVHQLSHYNIKVRTKGRILNIRSSDHYKINDVIYFNN